MKLLKRFALRGGLIGVIFSALLISFSTNKLSAKSSLENSYRRINPVTNHCYGSRGTCLPTVIVTPKPHPLIGD